MSDTILDAGNTGENQTELTTVAILFSLIYLCSAITHLHMSFYSHGYRQPMKENVIAFTQFSKAA